ncbi:hypothetical protein ACLB1Q_12905 [Escherichia coli]
MKFIILEVRRSGEHELSILTGVELVVKRGETIALWASRDWVSYLAGDPRRAG